MEPLISVIVPVYNVEKYLGKCIDSIINQTYRNIEIILVDDGSTDSSGEICDSYARQHKNVTTYHQTNGGLSSARNYGIERARGEYIGFVDSDDYIEPNMYEVLLQLLQSNNAEMSMCALYDVFDGKIRKIHKDIEIITVDREEAIKMVLEADVVSVTAVNKLYKRELFSTVRYPVGKTIEDGFVIVDLLSGCNRVAISSEQLYYYVHRQASITTAAFSEKNMDAIECYERIYDIVKNDYPNILEAARTRLCWAYFYVLDRLAISDSKAHESIRTTVTSKIKSNIGFILKNSQFKPSRKGSAAMLMLSWKAYQLCVKLQNKRYKIAN